LPAQKKTPGVRDDPVFSGGEKLYVMRPSGACTLYRPVDLSREKDNHYFMGKSIRKAAPPLAGS
jgi:hypothetical protein